MFRHTAREPLQGDKLVPAVHALVDVSRDIVVVWQAETNLRLQLRSCTHQSVRAPLDVNDFATARLHS